MPSFCVGLPRFSENTSDMVQQTRRRVRPKTYVFAVYLSIAIALVPMAALVSVFWLRHRVDIDTNSPRLRAPTAAARQVAAPEPAAPAPEPAAPPAPPVLQPRLGPARIPVPPDPAERIAADQRQARAYMGKGQNDLAKLALLDAEKINPRDPDTLRAEAELAESEKDWQAAAREWQAIVALGPEAGTAGPLAQDHLQRIPLPAPQPAAAPGGVVFHVAPTERVGEDDSRFMLKIPIAPLSSTAQIEPGKVGIKFYFYDQTKEGILVPTNARLQVSFEDSHPNWQGGRTEVLRAAYERPDPNGDQHFYGTIFRLYYDGVLQEERANPPSLLSLFPASG